MTPASCRIIMIPEKNISPPVMLHTVSNVCCAAFSSAFVIPVPFPENTDRHKLSTIIHKKILSVIHIPPPYIHMPGRRLFVPPHMNAYILSHMHTFHQQHAKEEEKNMQVQVLLQIAGIGLLVTVISQILNKAGREDLSSLTAIAGLVIVLVMVIRMVGQLLSDVQAIFHLT